MKKIVSMIVSIVAFTLLALPALWADDGACGSSGDGSKKFDEILENQKQIMATLSEIKTELNVVKIRASDH